MSGTVKRFGDLAASGALAANDIIPVHTAASSVDDEPVKATMTQVAAFVGSAIGGAASSLLTGSGNYTVPAGVYKLFAVLVGGGAGGGSTGTGAAATATSGQPGYVLTAHMDVSPGDVIAYVCGGKSSGATAGGTAADGADTTFGATLVAKGGKGGVGSSSGNAASPATTAVFNAALAAMAFVPTASLFTLAAIQTGIVGVGAAGVGGVARSTGYGLAGAAGNNAAGGNATGYGQAGGGAGTTTTTPAYAGGNGSDGCILVSF